LKARAKIARVLGAEENIDSKTLEIIKRAAIKTPQQVGYDSAELICFREVLSDFLSMALDLEVGKKVEDRGERARMKNAIQYKEAYIDNVVENLLDLKFALSTLDTGDPALYLASGVLKSVEGYAKYLVDEIRQVMRERDLKASKTKVTLAWSVDRFEMRGERLATLDGIADRLHDYIGDVNILNGEANPVAARGFTKMLTNRNKVDIVVICSDGDYKQASNAFNLKEGPSDTIIMNADLFIDEYR
jgi:hypothetical protein